jgi:predicted phage tail protein
MAASSEEAVTATVFKAQSAAASKAVADLLGLDLTVETTDATGSTKETTMSLFDLDLPSATADEFVETADSSESTEVIALATKLSLVNASVGTLVDTEDTEGTKDSLSAVVKNLSTSVSAIVKRTVDEDEASEEGASEGTSEAEALSSALSKMDTEIKVQSAIIVVETPKAVAAAEAAKAAAAAAAAEAAAEAAAQAAAEAAEAQAAAVTAEEVAAAAEKVAAA